MSDKDYKTILARYGFKDPYGHSLERCGDFLDLLAELERLRTEAKGERFTPEIEEKLRRNVTPRSR